MAEQLLRLARMEDAAYAGNLGGEYDIGAGYYGGPNAYHVWAAPDWAAVTGHRLPIWVAGMNGTEEGQQAAQALHDLGVPHGVYTGVDMEIRRDRTYLANFAAELHNAGQWRVWVYGSQSTVFSNQELNGYWVAAYGQTTHQTLALLGRPGVRAVQYEPNIAPGYDASLVRQWTEGAMWTGAAA